MFFRSTAALMLATAPLLAGCDSGPSDPYAAAEIALADGEPKAAMLHIAKAIEAEPDKEELRLLAGEIALALNNADRAVAEFKRIKPGSKLAGEAQARLSEAYLAQGNLRLARQTIEKLPLESALAYRVAVGLEYAEGDWQAGLAKLEQGLARFPADPQLITINAERLFKQGKQGEALRRIADLLAAEPVVPEAHMLAGQIKLGNRRLDEAGGHFEKVVAVRPNMQTAMLAMAAIERDKGNTKAAEEWIQKVANTGQMHPVALLFMAQMALDSGDAEKAHDLLQAMPSAFDVQPDVQRLEGLVASARGNPNTAIGALQRYFARSEGDIFARYVLAENLTKNGEFSNAWETIKPLIEHPQADPASLGLALRLAEKTGQGDTGRIASLITQRKSRNAIAEPLQQAGQAIRAGKWKDADSILSPLTNGAGANDPVVLNNAAAVKSRLGAHSEAISLARKAHGLAPDSPEILDTLGWALWQSGGAPDEARAMLTRARELAPRNQEIAQHWATAHAE